MAVVRRYVFLGRAGTIPTAFLHPFPLPLLESLYTPCLYAVIGGMSLSATCSLDRMKSNRVRRSLVAADVPHEGGNTASLAISKHFLQFGLLLLTTVHLLAARHVATTANYPEFPAEQLDTQWYGISGLVGLVAQRT
jgi:hypothetical protein